MTTRPFWEEENDVLLDDEISIGEEAQLLIYNDNFNTFEWVIVCLEQILNHTSEQAEQLSIMIHNKGKACVKTAPFPELRPFKDALCERGLSAVIEGEWEREWR